MDIGFPQNAQAESAARVFEDRLAGAQRAAASGNEDQAAFAFEKLFATLLVREMNRTLPEGFFSGTGSDTFNGWLEEHLGDALARSESLGIAEAVRASILRQQHIVDTAGDEA